ncbi:hypothetical protein AVEN_23684-1 [Araneus ventricosus]|uniref:Uncharacterized protein n=1 Tax=Araneus ventricosus TaxID=182803 RepID=A0A4Y2BHB9_ARAVE|nr:hypothetical protein AVEN_23684-1 [Araneus ventricosus]
MRLSFTMLPLILVAIFFTTTAFGGTLCPPREDIYPCSCMNIPINKKLMHTIVNCHHLPNSGVLSSILRSLKPVQIDQFHIYNSFWDAHQKGLTETNAVLPTDWLTLLRIKEMEIYDSALSSCFACQSKLTCKNTVTNRFSVVNSSLSEKMCTLCDTGKGNAYPWISCMSRLKHFEYTHGKLVSFGPDMFPLDMRELLVLNLTRNEITSVHRDALKKLKKLSMLDLSHNRLEYFDFVTTELNNLQFLDISWNRIKEIDKTQFGYLKGLKSFILASNDIVELKEESWKNIASSITLIDLTDNPLHCDCKIRWINGTFVVHVAILGTCTSPEDYEDSAIRKASRMLIERCDDDGNIGTRKKSAVTNPMILF